MSNRKTNAYRLGPLSFSLDGCGKLFDAASDEFNSLLEHTTNTDFSVQFVARSPQTTTKTGIIADSVVCQDDSYTARHSGMVYLNERLPGGSRKVTISEDPSQDRSLVRRFIGTFRGLNRVLDWNYLTREERLAKDFVYDVFDYVSQLELLLHNASYMHCSAFATEGQCFVITGGGGIGKTSLLLHYVMEKEWQYISDDLAIIGNEGSIWRTPKKLQVYGYNTENDTDLSAALLKGRGLIDLLAWHARLRLKGRKHVRRRISAPKLFGQDKILDASRITNVFFLERTNGRSFAARKLDMDDFANRSAHILLSELTPFCQVSLAVNSAGSRGIIPRIDEFIDEVRNIYARSLEGVDCILVSVPQGMSPCELSASFVNFVHHEVPPRMTT